MKIHLPLLTFLSFVFSFVSNGQSLVLNDTTIRNPVFFSNQNVVFALGTPDYKNYILYKRIKNTDPFIGIDTVLFTYTGSYPKVTGNITSNNEWVGLIKEDNSFYLCVQKGNAVERKFLKNITAGTYSNISSFALLDDKVVYINHTHIPWQGYIDSLFIYNLSTGKQNLVDTTIRYSVMSNAFAFKGEYYYQRKTSDTLPETIFKFSAQNPLPQPVMTGVKVIARTKEALILFSYSNTKLFPYSTIHIYKNNTVTTIGQLNSFGTLNGSAVYSMVEENYSGNPIVVAGNLLFAINTATNQIELLKKFRDELLFYDESNFYKFTSNRMFFTAFDTATGNELYVSNGSLAGTKLVADMVKGKNSSNIDITQSAACDNVLYFSNTIGGKGTIYRSDGTENGTFAMKAANDAIVRGERFIEFDNSILVGAKTIYIINSCNGSSNIKNNKKEQLINIYPNPSSQFITLSLPGEIYDIKIFNMQGQAVMETKYLSGQKLNINTLSQGLYTIQVKNNETSFSARLLKN